MHHTELPFICNLTSWFESLRARIERRPLVLGQVGRRLVALTAVKISLAMLAASFDLVIVTNALGHLPEPVAMLADMRHVLRGRFRLTTLIAIGHNASAGIAGKELNQ